MAVHPQVSGGGSAGDKEGVRATTTKSHTLGRFSYRKVVAPGSGGRMSHTEEVRRGWLLLEVLGEAGSPAPQLQVAGRQSWGLLGRWALLLPSRSHGIPLCVCVQRSPSREDAGQTRLGPTLMTSS